MSSRRRNIPRKDFSSQRTSRIGEVLREIIADELSRIDDERLTWVSVTNVRTDRSLDRAIVSYSAALDSDDDEARLAQVFEEHRPRLQAAINRQTHLRRTPPLVFTPDDQVRSAARIEEILRNLNDEDPASE